MVEMGEMAAVIKNQVIYVDMDDTLCDYQKAYSEALKREPETKWPQSQYGFFANLEPLENAIAGINFLAEDNDVYILTRPSVLNPLCYTEKRVWVEKHLGLKWCERLIICPDKSLMYGDYLIDDCVWKDFVGKQIVFNKTHCNWNLVINMFALGTV